MYVIPRLELDDLSADVEPDWDHPGAANTYLAGGNLGRFLALLKTLVLSAFPFTFGKSEESVEKLT